MRRRRPQKETPMTDRTRQRAGGPADGPAGRRARRGRHAMTDAFLTRTMKPFEIVSDEGLERSSSTTPRRSSTRSASRSATTRRRSNASRDAGCDVDGERVRFPRGLAAQLVRPPHRRATCSTPATRRTTCTIGGDATVFAPNYGSPFAHDLDNGRRYATLDDFQNFVKLTYSSPYLHHSGGTVCEPVDIPVSKRHLDMVYAHLRYSDKPFMGSVTAGERAADSRRAGPHRLRWRPRRPHRDDQPDQRLVAARVGRHDARRRRGLRRRTTRRRSSPRSSSPGRWRR